MFEISVIQVLLQLQKGSRNIIKILDISSADSNETFTFKFCNRNHQRRRDKRNQNVDTWNPQYMDFNPQIEKINASVEFTQILA